MEWLDKMMTDGIGRYLQYSDWMFLNIFALKYSVSRWFSPKVTHGREVVLHAHQSVFTYGRETAKRVLFMVPGGGFVYDRTGTIDGSMHALATHADMFIVVCPYQVAPIAKFPQIHDQVRVAFDDVVTRFQFQSDTALYVGGESAGGSIAMDTIKYIQTQSSHPLAGIILWYMTPSMTTLPPDSLKFQTVLLNPYDYAYYIRSYTNTIMDVNSPRFSPIHCQYARVPCLTFVSNKDIYQHVQTEFGNRVSADLQMVDHRHGYLSDIKSAQQDFPAVVDFLTRTTVI